MGEKIIIRNYKKEDELEWLDLHASLMVDSYAWWTVIHQKPEYKNESIDLVGVINDKIIALLTIEINADIIDLIEDDYGFAWEYGVHRDYRAHGYGKKLIKRAHKIMKESYGINKSIWFSQDKKAQKYYESLGMKEIERHWQFSFLPTEKQKKEFEKDGLSSLEIRASSKVDDFKKIKDKYKLIEDDALKARICIGYEYIP
ncbi:ribosomal protein S18 acetylase RimI-like enzyme [Halanaerobium saccharolyticum]|uniref:Ribosomal protein S18 acetylase RimI-like enzyme n=1 Tax=Halanaerobium saccharolyticum TaxID=43595 RepID=A0A4R6RRT7_9FIRM|nr:GNAT family N-acetyltransferase [Halanaerobium saccharolyticum]TDP88955.1 ribosomal protein S18 acetylase RimI-like enzyme [Halanaerobium saccharolyticum]